MMVEEAKEKEQIDKLFQTGKPLTELEQQKKLLKKLKDERDQAEVEGEADAIKNQKTFMINKIQATIQKFIIMAIIKVYNVQINAKIQEANEKARKEKLQQQQSQKTNLPQFMQASGLKPLNPIALKYLNQSTFGEQQSSYSNNQLKQTHTSSEYSAKLTKEQSHLQIVILEQGQRGGGADQDESKANDSSYQVSPVPSKLLKAEPPPPPVHLMPWQQSMNFGKNKSQLQKQQPPEKKGCEDDDYFRMHPSPHSHQTAKSPLNSNGSPQNFQTGIVPFPSNQLQKLKNITSSQGVGQPQISKLPVLQENLGKLNGIGTPIEKSERLSEFDEDEEKDSFDSEEIDDVILKSIQKVQLASCVHLKQSKLLSFVKRLHQNEILLSAFQIWRVVYCIKKLQIVLFQSVNGSSSGQQQQVSMIPYIRYGLATFYQKLLQESDRTKNAKDQVLIQKIARSLQQQKKIQDMLQDYIYVYRYDKQENEELMQIVQESMAAMEEVNTAGEGDQGNILKAENKIDNDVTATYEKAFEKKLKVWHVNELKQKGFELQHIDQKAFMFHNKRKFNYQAVGNDGP